jgi:hypothetical protein
VVLSFVILSILRGVSGPHQAHTLDARIIHAAERFGKGVSAFDVTRAVWYNGFSEERIVKSKKVA